MRLVLLPIAVLTANPALAAEAPPPQWQGVWKGAVGTLPVQACFNRLGDSYDRGVYYYLSSKRLIGLDAEKDGSWTEKAGKGGAESGNWKVAVAADGALRGEWQGGGKVLPVVLKRVGGAAEREEACSSRAFIEPRLLPAKITTKSAKVPGLAYSSLTYTVAPWFPDVSLRGFSFTPEQPGDKAILAGVRLEPDKQCGRGDYANCQQGAIGMLGTDGEYNQEVDPEWASPAYLAVMYNYGGFCGGAHPDWGYYRELWDRQSGKKVDLPRWFTAKALTPGGSGAESTVAELSPELRSVALRHFKTSEAECKDAASDQDWWGIGLTRNGFVFTPSFPHVIAACVDDAYVPFAEVTRFLSPAGKVGVARAKAGGK